MTGFEAAVTIGACSAFWCAVGAWLNRHFVRRYVAARQLAAKLLSEVEDLREELGEIDYFLVSANAKKKEFQRSYKKARANVQRLRGDVCEVVDELRELRHQWDVLVQAIIDRKPIQIQLPERSVYIPLRDDAN